MAVISTAAAYFITAVGATGYTALAIMTAARMLGTIILSKLISSGRGSNQRGTDGSRVQLPPATNNRLPVSYGRAWLRPTITDAKISTDQKTMWYVLAYCEVPDAAAGFGGGTISFGDIRWGDKKLNFDPVIGTRVISWTTNNDPPETDTRVNDKIHVYMYTDGSNVSQNSTQTAIEVLQDAGIASANRWAATDLMTKTAFLIVRINYDQNIGLTGLDQITAEVTNSLKDPGGVFYDYLTNERYGCAVDPANVNTASLEDLTTYSNQTITYTPQGGGTASQIRYAINGPLDTGQDCYQNLQTLSDACDSWLQWNEAQAQWGVVVNKAYNQSPNSLVIGDLFNLNDDNVIGSINLQPVDLNSTYNRIEVNYPETTIYDQSGFAYIDLDPADRNPNEPDNVLNLQLPVVNNNVQAKYLATRKLIQSREDLNVIVAVDYSGIQIDAGDVVRFNNSKYQWTDKLFRVTQVTESKDEGGSLHVSLNLVEYNGQVYDNISITEFIPSPNTGVTDPTIAATPLAPTVSDSQPSADIPTFNINASVPAQGSYGTIEIWVSSDNTASDLTRYTLLKTLLPSGSSAFTASSTVTYTVTGVVQGSYYFRTRVITATGSRSDYSPASTQFNWLPSFPGASSLSLDYNPDFYALSVPYGNTTVTGQSLPVTLSVLNGTTLTSYSTANTDSGMANDSWRVINISKTNLVLANDTPSTSNTSATWTLTGATQTTSSPATLAAQIRYRKSSSQYTDLTQTFNVNLVQSGATGNTGNTGAAGARSGNAYLYQYATTAPALPAGTAVYDFSTSTITSYSGTDGWSITGGTAPSTPGIKLWIALKQFTSSNPTESITWTGGTTYQAGLNGATGPGGPKQASYTVYQTALTIPAGPTGSSVYTWASRTIDTPPTGWTTSQNTTLTAGYTEWKAVVTFSDSYDSTATTIQWSTAGIGINAFKASASTGTTGDSFRSGFARIANNPAAITGLVTVTGDDRPTGSQGATVWGSAFNTSWSSSDPDSASNATLYTIDGIYSPTSNNTVWSTPYVSSLKVGTLSAITTNTGNLNVTGTIKVSTDASTANGVIMDSNGISIYNNSVLRVRLGSV